MKHSKEENPWKTISSREVYRNNWINVREDQVICPDGSPGIYGVVTPRIATGVVALTSNNEIYLVGQYRYPTERYSWEIIEGGTDYNETPLEAAKRELKEEAGLIAKSWKQLGHEIHLSNCFSSEICFLYIAREIEEQNSSPDHTEQLEIKKIQFSAAMDMVKRGEIQDAPSIIAILLAQSEL